MKILLNVGFVAAILLSVWFILDGVAWLGVGMLVGLLVLGLYLNRQRASDTR